MLLRKPLSLWIVVSLFVAAVALVPLAHPLLRRPVAPPRTITELTEFLSRVEPKLYVVPLPNGSEDGVWLCASPHSREDLMDRMLIRAPEYANQWKGIVICQGLGTHFVFPEYELEDWGEYGMRIGPLLFYGDPELLRRIHKAIFPASPRSQAELGA